MSCGETGSTLRVRILVRAHSRSRLQQFLVVQDAALMHLQLAHRKAAAGVGVQAVEEDFEAGEVA